MDFSQQLEGMFAPGCNTQAALGIRKSSGVSRPVWAICALLCLFVNSASADTLVGDGAAHSNRIMGFEVTKTLMGHMDVDNIQVLAEEVEDANAQFVLTGNSYPLEGISTHPLSGSSYPLYTIIVVRLAAGFAFEQCVSQMHKVMKLADRYHAHPLSFYRVESATGDLHGTDLIGIVGWNKGIDALRFTVKFQAERDRSRLLAAHQLSDDTAFVVQARQTAEHR